MEKFRNKETGKIRDFEFIVISKDMDAEMAKYAHHAPVLICRSIDQLNEEWEDYEPIEPLIKDEKIRKAIRAWAEADDLDNFRVQNEHFNCCKIIGYTEGINKASFIGFQTTIAHADSKKLYDIAELCGAEEE